MVASSSLRDAVADAKFNGDGTLYLGAYSDQEGTNLSYANLSLSILVTYTLPPTNISVTVRNDFGETPYDITSMKIDGVTNYIEPSGNTFTWLSNTFPHTLEAVDQLIELPSGFYNTRLKTWNNGSSAYTQSIRATSATYTATYQKLCGLHFTNYISGGSSGQINVNGTVYSVPSPEVDVWSGSSITAIALDQDYNYVHYTFSRWEDNSTNPSRSVIPSRHFIYTAYFTGTPLYPDANVRRLSVSQTLYQPLRLTWSEHPNPDVDCYKIYRKAKNTPSWVTPECIATLPRGTTSFDDPDYVYTNNFETILLYDVKACCSAFGTMSSDAFNGIYYGQLMKSSDPNTDDQLIAKVFVNSIANYPNPFNPATQIRYSIKEDGMVSLKVYDVLGNQVADLINEFKAAGSYSINFDGSALPSGVYIYAIKSGSYTETKKMLLMK